MNGKGLQLIEIYMGIGGLEFGSGVTRSPGLVLYQISIYLKGYFMAFLFFWFNNIKR